MASIPSSGVCKSFVTAPHNQSLLKLPPRAPLRKTHKRVIPKKLKLVSGRIQAGREESPVPVDSAEAGTEKEERLSGEKEEEEEEEEEEREKEKEKEEEHVLESREEESKKAPDDYHRRADLFSDVSSYVTSHTSQQQKTSD